MEDYVFENLADLLNQRKIPIIAYASIIGCSEKTARNKLRGKTEFVYSEIIKTRELFPEFKLSYLFAEKKIQ